MPKLPADFVKAPVFDNPLRPTTGKLVIADGSKELVVRFDAAEWAALSAAASSQSLAPEAFVKRLVEEWLTHGPRVAPAASAAAAGESRLERPRLLAQLVGRVQEQLASRFPLLRRFLPMTA